MSIIFQSLYQVQNHQSDLSIISFSVSNKFEIKDIHENLKFRSTDRHHTNLQEILEVGIIFASNTCIIRRYYNFDVFKHNCNHQTCICLSSGLPSRALFVLYQLISLDVMFYLFFAVRCWVCGIEYTS